LIKLPKPSIVINFKVYEEAEGAKALNITKMCAAVSKDSGVAIAVCPPAPELGIIARSIKIPVLAQNADPFPAGASTGWMTPSVIKGAGAFGTLINHTEHKSTDDTISKAIKMCGELNLLTIVCADSVEAAVRIAKFRPDIIAVEPPELIGGNVSVTDADPYIVKNTVTSVKKESRDISVLCGAGIKTGKDVKAALELGADGVLLASGIIRADDPKGALLDLIQYL